MMVPVAILAFARPPSRGFVLASTARSCDWLEPVTGLEEPELPSRRRASSRSLPLALVAIGVGARLDPLRRARRCPRSRPRGNAAHPRRARRPLRRRRQRGRVHAARPVPHPLAGRGSTTAVVDGAVNGTAATIGGLVRPRRVACRPASPGPTRCPCSAEPLVVAVALVAGEAVSHDDSPGSSPSSLVPLVGAAASSCCCPRPTRSCAKQLALGVSLVDASALTARHGAAVRRRRGGRLPVRRTPYSWIPHVRRQLRARRRRHRAGRSSRCRPSLVPVVLLAGWNDADDARGTVKGYVALILVLEACDGRRLRRHRRVPVLRLLRGDARPGLLPDRALRRPAPQLRRGEVPALLACSAACSCWPSLIGLYVVSADVTGTGTFDFTALAGLDDRPEHRRSGCSSASSSPSRSRRRWCRSTPGCPTPPPSRRPGTAVLLVGVLDKVGTFGMLRYCLELFPEASQLGHAAGHRARGRSASSTARCSPSARPTSSASSPTPRCRTSASSRSASSR